MTITKLVPAYRWSFIDNMNSLLAALEVLNTNNPSDSVRSSDLARNGILVVAYGQFEQFVTLASQALCRTINPQIAPFSVLPQGLQHEIVFNALKNFVSSMRFESKSRQEITSMSHDFARQSSYASDGGYAITPYTFKPEGYNLSATDINKFLKLLNIDNPWEKLGELAKNIGLGTPDLRSDLEAAHKNRNKAAHEAAFLAPSGDIEANIRTLLTTGCAFETLFNYGIGRVGNSERHDKSSSKRNQETMHTIIDIESIQVHDCASKWKVFPQNDTSRRAKISGATLEDCIRKAFDKDLSHRDKLYFTARQDGTVGSWFLSHDRDLAKHS